MVLITLYLAIAVVLVPLIFVAASDLGHNHPEHRRNRLLYSFLAAVVWPVLVIGLVQLGTLAALRRVGGGRQIEATEPALAGVAMPEVTGSFRMQPWKPAH